MKVIDISKHNGNVDFNKVKASGVQGVMIRAGYGIRHIDPLFKQNVEGCIKAGLHFGFYFYSYALNVEEAKQEANYCLEVIKGYKPTLPVAFDMEDADGYKKKNGMPSNKTLQDICKTFLSIVEKAGYYVSLYASLSWLNNQLNTAELDKYDKWVAQWSSKCTYNKPYGMWQYTDADSIPGSSARTDANIAYINYPAIIKEKRLNGLGGETTSKPVENKPANSQPVSNICVGSKVRIVGNNYATGEKVPEWVKKNTYAVQQISGTKALIKDILSWVYLKDLVLANGGGTSIPVKVLKVGSKVKIVGAKYATGQSIPSWVKDNVYTVQQIKGDRALIKEITSWVYTKDLKLV